MNEIKTGWTHATKDPHIAMICLLGCLNSGKNAWIELRDNGDQEFPIMIPNPVLDDPFKWQFSYGTPTNKEDIEKHQFLNETERDLTLNWVSVMGTPEAVAAYQKDRTIIEGLILGGSVSCPVRREDANRYRAEVTGDNYQYGLMTDWWKPLEGIPYYIPDPSLGKVFTVCYDDETVDMKFACRRAAEFLTEYEKTLK